MAVLDVDARTSPPEEMGSSLRSACEVRHITDGIVGMSIAIAILTGNGQ